MRCFCPPESELSSVPSRIVWYCLGSLEINSCALEVLAAASQAAASSLIPSYPYAILLAIVSVNNMLS